MPDSPTPHLRIGIDVGGTFTDVVATSPRHPAPVHLKEPSTPDDPSLAVLRGLERILEAVGAQPEEVLTIAHGTTIGLNAIVQRRGADVALVTSRGHRDILELSRRMPHEYDYRQQLAEPLVPRERVVEIDARLDAHGQVTADPDDVELDRVAKRLRALDVDAVAVTVLHSYLRPEFEADVARRLGSRLPGVPISVSAGIWPVIREYNRTSVVVLDSYIAPLMGRYLDRLQRGLADRGVQAPLYITASNGGSLGVAAAAQRPVDTILSGPASGVTATLALAQTTGLSDLISFDMGGTSSDIAIALTGTAEFAQRTEVGGLPLIMPVVDVNAIGAGGGSIARIDDQGLLQVGPESAGAAPGPAAYGLGGLEPTVTDAYVVSGVVEPTGFLGGARPLDVTAAHAALEPIADRLGLTGPDAVAEAAEAVLTVATAGMAAELSKVLSRRGVDASEFTLVPFGGAGPTHATLLAEELGIRSVVVPLAAGTYCALGAIGADLRRDFLRGIGRPLSEEVAARASTLLAELLTEGRDWVEAQGEAVEAVVLRPSLELRYLGQAFELDVPAPADALPLSADDVAELFHQAHEAAFGHRDTTSEVTVIAARLSATGTVAPVPLGELPDGETPAAPPTRRVRVDGAWHDAAVLTAADLTTGLDQPGPAVVDLEHTTVLVPPGWRLSAAPGNALRIDR